MKRNLTTGEFAKYFGVGHRTVLRWIREGYLDAFQLPGRGDNRIPIEEGARFMREHNIPLPSEIAQAVSPVKVLVVDDDESMTNMIRNHLQDYDFTIHTAADGLKAGAALMELRPELLILDLCIPKLDGFEVLKFVRQTSELKKTKILVVSGLAQDQLDKARESGADRVLGKPFEPDELLKAVGSLLSVKLA
ncbi:MAG: response regulator [Verrucomicrobiota bacterium]